MSDLAAADSVCRKVHGHDRSGELVDAVHAGTARVVEHAGHIVGYTTGIAFFAHSVAESNAGLRALITDAKSFGGPGFLLPARNGDLSVGARARRRSQSPAGVADGRPGTPR